MAEHFVKIAKLYYNEVTVNKLEISCNDMTADFGDKAPSLELGKLW